MRNKRWATGIRTAALAAAAAALMAGTVMAAGKSGDNRDLVTGPGALVQETGSFDADRFVLPQEAKVLVVVEGTEGSACNVYAFEQGEAGWELRVQTAGWLGLNGMSNHRTEGDKTTPIGVFQMNTPFGQDDPLDGFPSNYIKVDETYIWDQYANRLVQDTSASGEQVGTEGYAEH